MNCVTNTYSSPSISKLGLSRFAGIGASALIMRGMTIRVGKKIKGLKRHIIVDTLGLMVGLMVHSANIQDRDGAPDLLKSIRHRWPWLLHVFADGGYAVNKLKRRLKKVGRWTMKIIKRTDKAKGFEVLPRRAG